MRWSALWESAEGRHAMVDQERITERIEPQANKAAKLSGQAKDKATTIAGQVTQKAGPVAGQARDKAVAMAHKAAPVAGQARDKAVAMAHKAAPVAEQARQKAAELAHKAAPVAAHGVETTARKLDELTHGKYSDQLKSISTRLEHVLAGNGRSNPGAGGAQQD
jgi:replicative DNA helicase